MKVTIEETEKQLSTLLKKSRNANLNIRLEALLLKRQNPKWSNIKIAAALGANRRTIERWFKAYQTGGVEAVSDVKRVGSRLRKTFNEQQQALLHDAIKNGDVKTYQDARVWVFREYGISLPYKNLVMYIFKNMGISLNNRNITKQAANQEAA